MKILVVDDDPRLRELLTITLDRAGWTVIAAADGQRALTHAARERPDLIVLDIGLPELDGLEVCRRLRALGNAVPILFLTARGDEVDRILGLETGADDYLTKPFSPREVVARVRAILKRSNPGPTARGLCHGIVEVDAARHFCAVAGAPVGVTAAEMALLARLMQHPDAVLSRGQLIEQVWGVSRVVSDRTVDSHLRNLRRKLAAAGCPDAVDSVHGVGLRMGPCRG